MTPRETKYRLATTPRDYARCHELARSRGYATLSLSFPTVLAERAERVLGFMWTQPNKEAVIVGMLLADGLPRPGIIAWRLCDAYEIILRRAGVSAYHFHVEHQAPATWGPTLTKLGFAPWHGDDQGVWYRRNVAA